MRFSLFFIWISLSLSGFSQSIVVSEYLNAADVRDEWIELVVVQDNLNIVGYTLRDNNANQTAWQNEIVFANHSIWQNLRAGTIIVIWSRQINSALSNNPIDTFATDGYIELNAQLTGFFSGGSFGTSPSWSGNSLNIASSGELIQIRNSVGTHVHLLGHRTSPGIEFTNAGTPKLNHAASSVSGESIRVNPGATLAGYAGGSGTTLTTKSTLGVSKGLPNKSTTDSTSNEFYWRTLRQPLYPSPNLITPISNNDFSQFSLIWNSCTDLVPSDSTIGYLILRNTQNNFVEPQDGVIYTAGQSIGSSSVVAIIIGSNRNSFIDHTNLACGQTFYYKIFAFRFESDNQNNNSAARGRAYQEAGTNVVSITRPQPIPISSINAY